MNPPRITIILSSLNHRKFIAGAIQSVLEQTYTDFELFIIDDCSEDDSWEIIQRFNDPRIIAIQNPVRMRGAYGFNEVILNRAKGEFIAIHHSDDFWLPEKLEKQVAFIDSHPNVGAVFTQVRLIDESGKLFVDPNHSYQSAFRQPNRNRFEWLRFFFLEGNCLCHPSIVARKRALLDAGLYDRRLGQITDFDLWMRLCLHYEIYILDEALTYFRIRDREANQSGNTMENQMRSRNEWPLVLGRLLQMKDENEFLSVFPELRHMSHSAGNCIPFLLAMRAIETQSDFRMVFGVNLLYSLMEKEETATMIKEKYSFDYIDLIALSARADSALVLDAFRVQEHAHLLKKEIERIKNTFSWKITKPLRLLANLPKTFKKR